MRQVDVNTSTWAIDILCFFKLHIIRHKGRGSSAALAREEAGSEYSFCVLSPIEADSRVHRDTYSTPKIAFTISHSASLAVRKVSILALPSLF